MLSFVSVNWYSTGYYVPCGLDWGVVMALSIESGPPGGRHHTLGWWCHRPGGYLTDSQTFIVWESNLGMVYS